MEATVVGAGLAGCEAAYQLARRGIRVNLIEMKPSKKTPAHHSDGFAELICSNSLKAARLDSAAGLLKEEMRRLGSLLMDCADRCRVPAGGALAVDRKIFSELVTRAISSHPLIKVESRELTQIPDDGAVIIATGPLTSEALSESIKRLVGDELSFFDAAAPIVSEESIDKSRCFKASRYGKGDGDDYINCPLNKEEYEIFHAELVNAERAPLHDCDVSNPKVYEGCMPVEIMAQRGTDALRFGPMKPVGLTDPNTGRRPWAVVQLRKETAAGDMYNLVGFQTNLKFPEQRRVFGLIPALKNAQFLRYGVMHRNTFINSPAVLNSDFSFRGRQSLFFAGQLTGVEGYMESASSGLLCGINASRLLFGKETVSLPVTTMMGALAGYISNPCVEKFQPMGANLGVLPPLEQPQRDKRLRAAEYSRRALADLDKFITDNGILSEVL